MEYTEKYTQILQTQLIRYCTEKGALGGELFEVEELNECWEKSAPEYLADAVKEIAAYPTVSIAWACYFGMGAAALWDAAWENHRQVPDLYLYLRDKRGFDCLDEYVCEELLGIDAEHAKKLADFIGDCSSQALLLFRKEQVEPQSIEAYRLFHETVRIFFRLGVSIELYRMGYKYEKVILN